MDKKCCFCKILDQFKEADKQPCYTAVKYEYTVALVTHAWVGSKRNAGRSTDYRRNGLGYKLNFCPECGKDLKNE